MGWGEVPTPPYTASQETIQAHIPEFTRLPQLSLTRLRGAGLRVLLSVRPVPVLPIGASP
jgi:hypothetical protein